MIKYAGQNLLLEDPRGDLADFLDRHFSLDDLRLWGRYPAATLSPIRGPRSVKCLSLGIPIINYPSPPPLRINSLYWPSGATRWACGLFLCDDPTLGKIQTAVTGESRESYEPQQLVLADSTFDKTIAPDAFTVDSQGNVALSVSMYMLSPRPISNVSSDSRLWLLPLVDERYYWRDRTGTVNTTSWTTYFDSLFSALATESDIDTVSAAWGRPDPTELARDYQNPAVLLDAAAHSIGRRVVRGIDGVTSVDDSLFSSNLAHNNITQAGVEIAGADIDRLDEQFTPEKVAVIFRDPDDSDTLHKIEIDSASISSHAYFSGQKKVFFTTSRDSFTSGGGSDPTAASTNLATAIATDFIRIFNERYDRTYGGVRNWFPCGTDDYVMWSFGRRLKCGEYQAETRAISMPVDVGVDVNLCQCDDSATEDCAPPVIKTNKWGILTDDTASYASCSVLVCEGDKTDPDAVLDDDSAKVVVQCENTGASATKGRIVSVFPMDGLKDDVPNKCIPEECENSLEEATITALLDGI